MALAVGAALVLAATAPRAQPDSGGGGAAQLERRVGEIRERLALTEEQAEATLPILRAAVEKQRAVLAEHGFDPGVRAGRGGVERPGLRTLRKLRRDMDAVRAETAEKLAEVLDEEQLAEYGKIQEENRREMRHRIRAAR